MAMSKVFNIGKTSIFIGNLKYLKNKNVPQYSYFDGGGYFKLSFYWLRCLLEISRPKKDKTIYKKASYKEINNILKKLK